ncbi:uncharacterized protein LOC124360260 [Homalodisca vitripennis]|uniref:uncharacterized protein LOC124360260 n=1 Tax=Homalodisca vitripennis TaxID=197043 RepID=UPI001EEA3A89|nr:uncharacterized protein LOC124360260 [Homalodisca vitripennis]
MLFRCDNALEKKFLKHFFYFCNMANIYLVFISMMIVTPSSYCITMLEPADIFKIRGSPEFIDKTMLIKEFINNADTLILAAPDGFGKSTNLDMIRVFLSKTVDKKQAEDVFRNTEIYKEEALLKAHFNNHPVIHCSFKPNSPVTDYETMLMAFRNVLHQTFLQHQYLTDSPHLTKNDLKELKSYTDEDKYKTLKPIQISVGLYVLSQILERHHGKQVILLIDDYDSVLLDSIFTKSLDIAEVFGFYNAILSGVLLHNEHVNTTILTGTTCVSMKPLVDLENLQCVKFLQDETFKLFFGLTETEVDDLLGRDAFKKFQLHRQDIKMWYDGYTDPDLSIHIYNTRSVVNFLKSGDLKSYLNTIKGEKAFKVLLEEKVTKQLFRESSQNVMIVVRHLTEIDQSHMEGLKNMIIHQIWNEDFSDLYVHILMEKGYFTFDTPWERSGYNSSLTVKFPNIEVCETIRQIVHSVIEEAKKHSSNLID